MAEREDQIVIRGARVHNLKNLDCELPRGRLVVITGPSGSGKSSLAFDTLYAEGQRRYVESLGAYARQFLEQMDKPAVESISGLSPAIAIEQRTLLSHPRSTVATVTEIYDHLRVLFSALGRPHCPRCERPIRSQSAEQMTQRLLAGVVGTALTVLAPVVRGRKGAFRQERGQWVARGLRRARVDGRLRDLSEPLDLDPRRNHQIDLVIERLVVRPDAQVRLRDALEKAMGLAQDLVTVAVEGSGERTYSRRLACVECDVSVTELVPRAFSFNSPYGACPACDGLGVRWAVDARKVIPDEGRSLMDGAVLPWQRHGSRLVRDALEELAARYSFSLEAPLRELSKRARQALLQGDAHFAGVLPSLSRKLAGVLALRQSEGEDGHERESAAAFEDLRPYVSEKVCSACGGARLRKESLAVRVGGRNLAEYARLSIAEARQAFAELRFPDRERPVADRLLQEIAGRLGFLESVGVGYLSLDRPTTTLSSGEAHRIRLAGQMGARLQGVLYVLDEPTVGLHPRDSEQLLDTLRAIRDHGNTVVVVEHDEQTIRASDWIVDLGEGAGLAGGSLMYQGPPSELNGSLTGRYLRRELRVALPARRREAQGWLTVRGARAHNLRDQDVSFPLGVITAVTGVSGAGKSTLVEEILHRALAARLHGSSLEPGRHRALEGAEAVDKVIAIDQSPIGRTPRSNPATYTGAFAFIRELFSMVPEARARGYKPGRFSFNVKGGRCEACQGDGVRAIAMHFLPDVYVGCTTCRGQRYSRETLEILYHGRTIADVLDMSVEESQEVLGAHPRLARLLSTLRDVGLGYLRLGQSASTLSGGEAQRVKLARELARRETGRTLYILDEPTTGLHFDDVRKLLHVLGRLVDSGNTVVLVEHNLDMIKSADWVIDLGPEAGPGGGRVVAAGTPEQVAASRKGHTARFLRTALQEAEA